MKILLPLVLNLIISCAICQAQPPDIAHSFSNQTFGQISVLLKSKAPKYVIIFFTAEKEFAQISSELSETLAAQDALVIIINSAHYLSSTAVSDSACAYLAGEIVRLSQTIQSELNLVRYEKPFLSGYAVGAALAYAILAQHPNDFLGGMGFNFQATIPINKAFCPGDMLQSTANEALHLHLSTNLSAPWVSVNDEPNLAAAALPEEFKLNAANYWMRTVVPKVGAPDKWQSAVSDAFAFLVKQTHQPLKQEQRPPIDLPIIEASSTTNPSDNLVLFFSGDGGWASIDSSLAELLARDKNIVIGIDSLKYFWHRKSAEQAANDTERILTYYQPKLGVKRIFLVGFSYGSDVLPFIISRLAPNWQKLIAGVILLSPSKEVDLEIHIGYWLGVSPSSSALSVISEVKRLSAFKIACYYGMEDKDNACLDFPNIASAEALPGDHHFAGDYPGLAKKIIMFIHSQYS